MSLEEVLYQAFLQNYHLDHSNAAIHCGTVRYSPLTFRLAEAIDHERHNQGEPRVSNMIMQEVYTVLLDKGAYEEDKGR